MNKRCFWGVGIIALVFALTLSGFAQQGGQTTVRGNLAGVIVDSTGAVIPGANVTVFGPTGNTTVTSEADGRFAAPLLTPGSYTIKVEKQGFRTAEIKAVEVVVGKTSSVTISMQPGSVSEVVEVSAAAVTVDTTSTAVSSNLPDTFYNNIPIARGVQNLFYVSPGVATSGESQYNPSISGGSALENLYVADGISINDQAFGGIGVMTPLYGSLGTGINLSFIKEVQVKTGSYEPQYGNTTGGVVQIVTKSGTSAFHGAVSGYFAPSAFEAARNQRDSLRKNKVGDYFGGDNYDASAELGGYVPYFKNHLFFFGSFNPSWQKDYWRAPPLAGIYDGGHVYPARKNTYNYAGKLTLKLTDKHQIEASYFGDPSHTGSALPNEPSPIGGGTYNKLNNTGFSKWQYGTRNLAVRYNGTLSSTWLLNGSYTYNRNVFDESPLFDVFQVSNQTETDGLPGQRGVFTQAGFGLLENHKGHTNGWNVDTQKVVHGAGEHTLSVGFSESLPLYDQVKRRSGGRFAIPTTNATGGNIFACSTGAECPVGHNSDAQWVLKISPKDSNGNYTCTLCPLYPVLGYAAPIPVYLQQSRGEFGAGGIIHTTSTYLTGWANDSWVLNKHLSINAGLRWDQQHIAGQDVKYTFTDGWSPRIGFSVDPWGDRKTKIYGNFGRYSYGLPLDAAVRSLSSEFDLLGLRLAPVINGTSIQIVPDAAHVLNLATGGINSKPTINVAGGGEFMVPGTRWTYEDEFVAGAEHEFKGGIIVSARYLDRRLKRIIEDMSGASPEFTNLGVVVPSFIGNPGPGLDASVNEKLLQYTTAAGLPPGSSLPVDGTTTGCALDPANPTAPLYGADDPTDANGNFFLPAGQSLCATQVGGTAANPLYGGEPTPDGKSDGFVQPSRAYQAVEIEVNKQFSHNWMLRSSWTISRLYGNYQGAFRGDNGQIDPGISSLFDFTAGVYNLLGDQFNPGHLPSDRRNIINGYLSYVFDKSMLKGLTLGTGIRVNSGIPISKFTDHPVYGNAGEVPLGGRGILGRTPVNGQVDVHAEFPWHVTEKQTLSFVGDFFNIANSKTKLTIDQQRDLGFQPANSNVDFLTPTSYQRPFYARFAVRWAF